MGSATRVETRLAASQSTTGRKDLAPFRRTLLSWYDKHQRDLPWRKTRDPYRIWLSEIMLQQTRVAAVLDRYRTFLERFPSVEALATATEDAVLAAWSGLGYYRRARMLHRCAQELVEKYDRRFPQKAEALLTLPGIGRYTASAIASIAFDEPTAAVDGNVERVVQRLAGDDLTQRQIRQHAQSLLSPSRAGDFNQSMMELGATICLPRAPNCSVCPVGKFCVANHVWRGHPCPRAGATSAVYGKRECRPHKSTGRQLKQEIWCVLTERDGHIRLVQRSRKSTVMPGMWELPHLPPRPHGKPVPGVWRTFRHSITVTDFTVQVCRSRSSTSKGKWIPVANISQLPLTGLTRKILKAAGII